MDIQAELIQMAGTMTILPMSIITTMVIRLTSILVAFVHMIMRPILMTICLMMKQWNRDAKRVRNFFKRYSVNVRQMGTPISLGNLALLSILPKHQVLLILMMNLLLMF